MTDNTAAGRYAALSTEREPFLTRGRDAAALTVPGILPENGHNSTTVLPTPFQSVGARGCNNLTSKLLLALFPPGSSFFRLSVDEFIVEEAADQMPEGTDAAAEFETALAKVERVVTSYMESSNARSVITSALKHIIVTGNGLLQVLPGGDLKLHPLDSYCIKRDVEGQPIEIIIEEGVSPASADEKLKPLIDANLNKDDPEALSKSIPLFTRAILRDGKWQVHQEIFGESVEGTEGTYPRDRSALIPLRWNIVDGESYGRGFVEEYIGDLASLESLSEAIISFAAASSKIVFFVNPSSVVDVRTLERVPSGAFVEGSASDVTMLQVSKMADFSVANEVARRIEQRMEQSFLLHSAVQRQAERVTAAEVRFLASELEQALGGVYSTLSSELQRPLVDRLLYQLQREKKLPKLPKEAIQPKIVTGLAGLGRQGDLTKLDLLIQGVAEAYGPQAVTENVNIDAYISRRASALGIDIDGIVKSPEQKAAEQQAAQRAAMMQQAAGPGVKAMTDVALKRADLQAEADKQSAETEGET